MIRSVYDDFWNRSLEELRCIEFVHGQNSPQYIDYSRKYYNHINDEMFVLNNIEKNENDNLRRKKELCMRCVKFMNMTCDLRIKDPYFTGKCDCMTL